MIGSHKSAIQLPVLQYPNQESILKKLQIQNTDLKGQVGRWSSMVKSIDEKYQKSLKQMSSVIQANRNLKSELDDIKQNQQQQISKGIKIQEQQYEIKLLQLQRQKAKLEQDYDEAEKRVKDESVCKESQINDLKQQIRTLQQNIQGLSTTNENNHKQIIQLQTAIKETKDSDTLQSQILELRDNNIKLITELQEAKIQSPNHHEVDLLNTLREMHSQLQPLRYEIEELKRENRHQTERSLQEISQLQIQIINRDQSIQMLSQRNQDLQLRNTYLIKQSNSTHSEKKLISELQEQKGVLEGKIIVYETMQVVNKNRQVASSLERVREFESRINLILSDDKVGELVSRANIHHLISMKAYIMEMSTKLEKGKEDNEHSLKKYRQYKEKYGDALAENKKIWSHHYEIVQAYKGKISSYELLVEKLTSQLQNSIEGREDNTHITHTHTSFNSILTLYETKIKSMHLEVSKAYSQLKEKQRENEQLKYKVYESSKENQKITKQNEEQLIRMRQEGQQLQNKYRQETHSHQIAISEKTKTIIGLEAELQRSQKDLAMQFEKEVEVYKVKINMLQNQIQSINQQNNQLRLKTSVMEQQNQSIKQLSQQIMTMENRILQYGQQNRPNAQDRMRQRLSAQNKYYEEELNRVRAEWKDRLLLSTTQHNQQTQQLQSIIKHIKSQHELEMQQQKDKETALNYSVMNLQTQALYKDKQIKKMAQLENTIDDLQNKNREWQDTKRELQSEIRIIRRDYEASTKVETQTKIAKVHQLQAHIQRLNTIEHQLQTENQQLKAQHTLIKQQIQTSQLNINELNQHISLLEKQHTSQIDKFRNQVISKNQIIQELEKVCRREDTPSKGEIENLHKIISEFEKQIAFLENELKQQRDHMVNEIQECHTVINNSKNKEQELLTIISNKTEAMHVLELQLNEKVLALSETEKMKVLEDEIHSLHLTIEEMKMSSSIEELHKLRRERQELLGLVKQREAQIENIKIDHESMKQMLRRLQSDNQKVIIINQQLSNEIQKIREALVTFNESQTRNEELLSILVLSFAEIDSLRNKIESIQSQYQRQHQTRIQALKHVSKLVQYDTNVHYELVKELELAHAHLHSKQHSYASISLQNIQSEYQTSPYKPNQQIQIVSPHHFYQYSQPSRESISFQSKNSIEEQLKQSSQTPYIMSNNQLKK